MKRIISLMLALCIMLSIVPAYADDDFNLLKDLGIFVGDGDGNMRYEDSVSRSEFAKLAVMASSYRDYVAAALSVSPFSDVSASYWASPYIKIGVDNGLFTGYPDGTFRPDNTVTYEEAVTMVLRALGYTADDFGASYPYGQLGIAENIDITENVNLNIGDVVNRRNAAQIIDNALNTKMKGSNEKLYTSFDCDKIEKVTIIASNREDSSVNSRQVYTSRGTFYINPETFDYSLVGKYGDMYVKNGDEFLSFEDSNQTMESYTVTDTMGTDLVLGTQIKDIDEKTTVYYKSNTLTYANTVSYAKEGDTFTIVKAADGTIDYCLLRSGGSTVTSTDVNLLETYAVYSLIDSGLIVYGDGKFSQVKIDDDATAYKGSTASKYSAVKTTLSLGDIIRIKRDTDGDIDYLKIDESDLEGPVIASGDTWRPSAFTGVTDCLVLRDGETVTFDSIKKNDVIYYSTELKMVLAYNDTAVGTYEKAAPDKNSPVTVTVSGVDYAIETAEAFDALSSNGSYKYGDTVKLLLGKDGKIAAVTGASTSDSVTGYVTEINQKNYTNASGGEYTSNYARLVLLDGTEVEYQIDRNYSLLNSVVTVKFDNGVGRLTRVSNTYTGVSGSVDADAKTLGKLTFADDVDILDVSTTNSSDTGSWAKVFLSRLDGVTLTNSDILYMNKVDGQITELVLKDVTGDCYSYGVVTASNVNRGETITGTYTIDINGTKYNVSASGRAINISTGSVVKASMKNGNIDNLYSVSKYDTYVSDISDLYCTVGTNTLRMSDNVVCYARNDVTATYQKVPVNDIKESLSEYNVYAYYDGTPEYGGRVRVILATKR